MEKIGDLSVAEQQVFRKVRQLIHVSRGIVSAEPPGLPDGIEVLKSLREGMYENLNQIQHEELVLRAARFLQREYFRGQDVEWSWNPRQTGVADEPDLRGAVAGQVVVSAEITSSARPQGTIDQRMRSTLERLSGMPGNRFYFVSTEAMERRARTKVNTAGYKIEVRRI